MITMGQFEQTFVMDRHLLKTVNGVDSKLVTDLSSPVPAWDDDCASLHDHSDFHK